MRDYRLPKPRQSRLRDRTSRRQPLNSRTKKSQAHGNWSFSTFFLVVFLTMILLSIIGYSLLSLVVPRLFPLTQDKNIVFVSSSKDESNKEILIAHYHPRQQNLVTVKIPATDSVPIIGGFGEYPLRSLQPLLHLEKKDQVFVRSAFSYAVGEVIDGVVVSPQDQVPQSQSDLKKTLRQAILARQVEGLSWQDQISLFFFTAHLPSDKFAAKELNNLEDWAALRSKLALQYSHSECPVAVINTIRQPGLAKGVSTLLEQSGYVVMRVTDSDANLEKSVISFDRNDSACAAKAEAVSRIFPYVVEIKADSGQAQTYRAKIILELGQDLQGVIPEGR